MTARYAAIDIGTVTSRLLVADVDADGRVRPVVRESIITELGEGVDATGRLAPAAMQRVAAAMRRFCELRDAHALPDATTVPTVALATSAARDAQNAGEFVELLAGCGVELSVIPGAREAQLSFRGASCDFAGEDLMVVDPGGGSTEVICGRGGAEVRFSHSFNVGCRRITDRFLQADPPTADEIAAARAWVRGEMQPFFAQVRESGFCPQRLVAVAGTATSAVSMRDALDPYDRDRVHKAQVTRAQLDALSERLCALTVEERRGVVGLNPKRAPVIAGGMVILQEILKLAGVGSFTVSETDILYGIILSAADAS